LPEDLKTTEGRILVVDDDPEVVRLITRVLKSQGYGNVISTTDSKEVMNLCHTNLPDLVLLDLNMPAPTGFELLEEIHQEVVDFEPIPVVVLTGERGRKARMRALNLGAADYIVKPFDLEIMARIKNLLERRLLGKKVHLQKLELEQRVRERTAELEEAQIETVRRLGIASEYRDDDTGVHVVRIHRYVKALALAQGEDEYTAELMGLAAKLHDLGKLGIPDAVLLKPGKLTTEEFELMKKHTIIGAQILSGAKSRLLQMAEIIALNHHEKWNGAGYPSGLVGEEIPQVARLVSVCDVFDALTSVRPYKEAWPLEDALVEIKRGRGSHFDPAMVDLFFENQEIILEIKRSLIEDNQT
jgi:putative two-component system response regulator